MTGTVKWWNKEKRYGFITMLDGRDVFAHYSELKYSIYLDAGQTVEFDLYEMNKGLEAKNIREPS